MLQPQFNRYPKPTDLNSLYFLAQQAFETGFRGTTFKELVNYIIEYLPERLSQFQIYDVDSSGSPIASDDVTRTYQPTESGTYTNFLDSDSNPLEVDLTEGFVTITGNTTSGFKTVVTPIDLSGYVTTGDLSSSLNEKLGQIDTYPYSGTLPYRYYNNPDNSTYTSSSVDVSQTDNGKSDSIQVDTLSAQNIVYLETNHDISVDSDNIVVFEAKIDASNGVVGVGPAYGASGAVRGIMYLSNGTLIRAIPRTYSGAEASGLPELAPGDIVRFEISIKGPTDQNFRILRNGVVVYDDSLSINIPVSAAKWWLAVSGDVTSTINKMGVYVYLYASREYVNSLLHPSSPQISGFRVLPDRPNGAPTGGFTCTGLDRITRGKYAGCWLIANDGRTVELDGSPYDPEVLVLDADFTRIVAVFPMPYSGASAQGVAVDTSGTEDTFWVSTSGHGKLLHFDFDGNEIAGDAFDWVSAYPSFLVPNGLAYDPVNDALWCSDTQGNARLISCNPSASPRELADLTLTNTPDMLHFNNGQLYYSRGGNGANGHISVCDVASGSISTLYASLDKAQAIEGIFIDDINSELIVMNDGGYHDVAKPALNIVLKYRI